MSGISGWFSKRLIDQPESVLRRMAPASGPVNHRVIDGSALAMIGGHSPSQLVDRDGFAMVVVGHPQLITPAGRSGNLDGIARALQSRGTDALEAIGGDFALAAWNRATGQGLVAIDRIGVHQIVYRRLGDTLVFASTLDALGGYPQAVGRVSPQAIFDFLYFHACPGPDTIYEGVQRLPAGTFIEFNARGADEAKPYWTMRFREESAPFDELKVRFKSLLRGAVEESAGQSSCGAFLSGGTDSSTVSGMLNSLGRGRAKVFSIGFDVPGYDEMNYARVAARHFGCEHIEYYVTPADVVNAVPHIATFYDQPFGNASAIPTYMCARVAAEHGVTRLLAGDGGDELFGGNDRYAKQYILSQSQHVPTPLRRGLIEPVVNSGVLSSLPLLKKVASYVHQASPAMPWRYESYNLLNHLGAENVLAPDFLKQVHQRHPQDLLADAHAPFVSNSLINQLLGIDLRFTLADSDLPKVTRMCELGGVDVAFPMLDDRVVEFSATLPANLKLQGTQLRWFFKKALDDFLPREVIEKQKQGFGLPVGAWLVGHRPLFELAADAVNSLRPHGIVRESFFGEILGPRLAEHPKYYGTMIWILMMLGLWLESRRAG